MTLQILADENIPAVAECFGDLGNISVMPGRAVTPDALAGVDILLVRSVTAVNEALLGESNVRFVGTATSGVDHIDRDYLRSRSIQFGFAPGANANSVVEYVLAAIAAVSEKLEQLLAGGTVGIVGYGVIGKLLARRLDQLEIAYKVYDPWLDSGAVVGAAPFGEVLACDVVTLHCELTDRTPYSSRHLLGADELRVLDPTSLLINASRGAVTDNTALAQQLAAGRGPYTVLDVWEKEPQIDADLLERVTLGTAHIAGYSLDAKLAATHMLRSAFDHSSGSVPVTQRATSALDNTLSLPAGLSRAALLRHLLQCRYDIFQDDALLREATSGADSKEAASAFDGLRRNYTPRRELLGAAVTGDLPGSRDRALVAALGCEFEESGTKE